MATALKSRSSRKPRKPVIESGPLPNLRLEVREGNKVIREIELPDPRIVYAEAYREWYPNRTICFVKAGKGVSR